MCAVSGRPDTPFGHELEVLARVKFQPTASLLIGDAHSWYEGIERLRPGVSPVSVAYTTLKGASAEVVPYEDR